jgi:hypothetical protein
MLDPKELRRRADALAARAEELSAQLGQRRVRDRRAVAYAWVARGAEAALLHQLADEIERNARCGTALVVTLPAGVAT